MGKTPVGCSFAASTTAAPNQFPEASFLENFSGREFSNQDSRKSRSSPILLFRRHLTRHLLKKHQGKQGRCSFPLQRHQSTCRLFKVVPSDNREETVCLVVRLQNTSS